MTKIVVGEFIKGEKNPKIIGAGESMTRGMRHGYVVNSDLASTSIKEAVAVAEKTSGIKIKQALISIGGTTLRGNLGSGVAVISKADGEVTSLDINKALEDCEDNLGLANKKVIHVFPISFRLDGKEVLGRIEGMRGAKLEIKALIVSCSSQHLEDLLEAVEMAGVRALDVIASPVAAANLILSEKQKIVGSALVNIGSETVSVAIFENGSLVSLHTFSIGASDITNDIALGLKISLDEAESLKLGTIMEDVSKKKLDEIIEARLSDIFELIDNHLKKMKRSELLPAGIIWIGGGASILGLEELSKSALKLPSTIGTTDIFGNAKTKLRDGAWSVALGLLVSGKDSEEYGGSSFLGIFKNFKSTIKSSVKQLMP